VQEQTKRENILVFSHTANMGGAERAILYLSDRLLRLGHQVHFAVPSEGGPFIAALQAKGLPFTVCQFPWILPDFSTASILHSNWPLEAEANKFREQKFDLAISNTSVILAGAFIASALNIPHIFYIHEILQGEPDLSCSIVSSSYINEMLCRLSSGMLFCSYHAQKSFCAPPSLHSEVIYPIQPISNYLTGNSNVSGGLAKHCDLLLVGFQNRRKNMAFSLDVLTSLRIRGWDVRVHILGQAASGTGHLNHAISSRGLSEHVIFHGYKDEIFNNKWDSAIHLICSLDEPFGLTVIEAMCAGIPVVSSACGGPQESIGSGFVYNHNDLDACVRMIEYILGDYSYFSGRVREDVEKFLSHQDHENDISLQRILAAVSTNRAAACNLPVGLSRTFHDALTLRALPRSEVIAIAGEVAGIPPRILTGQIEGEKANPGQAVTNDCRMFDVVPFADSRQMKCLYQMGTGFIVELLANFDEVDPMRMTSYAMHALLHHSASIDSSRLKVLALGDGVGIDSMRLSALGLDVDYVDFEHSLTSRVASKLFERWASVKPACSGTITAVSPPIQCAGYDAVLCLEVIEHVDNVDDFLKTISSCLKEDGIVLISECFWGILPRWPTHLAKHRTLSHLLPILAAEYGLEFVASNKFPFGKPFLFRKSAHARGFSAIDEITWSKLLNEQMRLRV
jgi:glycosyltransferase involved in cell wall biosynthesis/2-polyprenyl-3-methyl-5-hydroxy-6-metoxy-1,4-benzoquinol methylase